MIKYSKDKLDKANLFVKKGRKAAGAGKESMAELPKVNGSSAFLFGEGLVYEKH